MGHTTNRRHLKRLAAPKTWPIPRKGTKFITKSSPGPHSLKYGMPIILWIREYLNIAKNSKEAKYILSNKKIKVDGKVITDKKFPVGIMDVLKIEGLDKVYRVFMSPNNKLILHEIPKEEEDLKIVKIIKKQSVRGNKTQLTTHDGRNFLVEDSKKYKTGDSLLIKVPSQEIVEHIPLEEGSIIYIFDGAKVGKIGKVIKRRIEQRPYGHTRFVVYKDLKTGEEQETIEDYVIVVGKEKPIITLPENI